jgi:hypothetical protein
MTTTTVQRRIARLERQLLAISTDPTHEEIVGALRRWRTERSHVFAMFDLLGPELRACLLLNARDLRVNQSMPGAPQDWIGRAAWALVATPTDELADVRLSQAIDTIIARGPPPQDWVPLGPIPYQEMVDWQRDWITSLLLRCTLRTRDAMELRQIVDAWVRTGVEPTQVKPLEPEIQPTTKIYFSWLRCDTYPLLRAYGPTVAEVRAEILAELDAVDWTIVADDDDDDRIELDADVVDLPNGEQYRSRRQRMADAW